MKAYWVKYRVRSLANLENGIQIIARTKEEAYDLAVYEEIPKKHGTLPYSAWVYSVTYNNGNERFFNTFEGKPY